MFCFPSLQARRAAGEELLPEEDPTVMKPVREGGGMTMARVTLVDVPLWHTY